MYRVDVVKRSNEWQARDSDGAVVVRGATKIEVVRRVALWARRRRFPVTVKIHLVNGRIAEERTYPSSADPRRSAG